jgi:hypothetical protein
MLIIGITSIDNFRGQDSIYFIFKHNSQRLRLKLNPNKIAADPSHKRDGQRYSSKVQSLFFFK